MNENEAQTNNYGVPKGSKLFFGHCMLNHAMHTMQCRGIVYHATVYRAMVYNIVYIPCHGIVYNAMVYYTMLLYSFLQKQGQMYCRDGAVCL